MSRLTTLTCLRMNAPTLGGQNNMGNLASNKKLRIPYGATGYDTGNWKTQFVNRGFVITYID